MTNEEFLIYRLRNPLDINLVDRYSFVVDGVDRGDHPDYVDAYISEAYWLNGDVLTDQDLDWLNEFSDIVHEAVYESEFLD